MASAVHVATFRASVEALQALGLDVEALLAAIDLTADEVATRQELVSVERVAELWSAAQRRFQRQVAEHIYRIHTPVTAVPGGFSFNQYLLAEGEEALIFHTGPRALAPRVIESIAHLVPLERLRYVAFGHVESDECGGLNAILAAAPNAVPVCSTVGAMVQVGDLADRTPEPLADDATLEVGSHRLRWIDAPHVPHGWDNGYLFDEKTKTLFCGDLFTQPGSGDQALVEDDILGPSEGFRQAMDYYAHAPQTTAVLERLVGLAPRTLACMHGSAFRGDGGEMIDGLAQALASSSRGLPGQAAPGVG